MYKRLLIFIMQILNYGVEVCNYYKQKACDKRLRRLTFRNAVIALTVAGSAAIPPSAAGGQGISEAAAAFISSEDTTSGRDGPTPPSAGFAIFGTPRYPADF